MRPFVILFILTYLFSCSQDLENNSLKENAEPYSDVENLQISSMKNGLVIREVGDSNINDIIYGSIEYYLANSISYAPYINLSFVLPELLEGIRKNTLLKDALKKKFTSTETQPKAEQSSTVEQEIQFLKDQLKTMKGHDEEKKFMMSLIPNSEPLVVADYQSLFTSLSKSDGAAHWEIANTLFTLLIVNGNRFASIKDQSDEAQKGYADFIDNLERYCFVAMADDNVPKEIIERKREYLLAKICGDKYPELYKKLQTVKIREIE